MTVTNRLTSSRLIGRDAELAPLLAAAERAAQGEGQMVLLAGEPGIGKTRLLAELLAAMKSRWPGQVFRAQCYREEQSFPLAPLQFALAARLGDKAAPSASAPSAGAPGAGAAGDPAGLQRSLFEAAAAALFDLAASGPLLAVFEDLHWSDESTLAFVRFFGRRIATRPVLLVGTFRPGDAPAALADLLTALERAAAGTVGAETAGAVSTGAVSTGAGPSAAQGPGSIAAQRIDLGPLGRSEVDALLHDLIGPAVVPGGLVDEIHAASGGNPLYVEEIVRAMIQAGDIRQGASGWELRGGVRRGPRVPQNVQDAVRRQSAGLSARAGRILGVAAVAGREFAFDVLAAVTGLPDAELVAALKELVTAGLIEESREDAFTFRHPLLREAAQAQLLARERRALHRQVAEALERLPGVAAAELAYHYYEAGAWEPALAHAQVAAEQAAGLDAVREALRHLDCSLDCAEHLGLAPPLDLLLRRAELAERAGEFEAAGAGLEKARAEAERLGRPREAWEALLKLGYLWSARDYGRSLAFLEEGLAVAETLADPVARAETLNRIGNVYLNRDQPGEALPYHRAALAAFEAAGDAAGQAGAYEMLAVCYYNLPDVLAGAACEERALALGREAGARLAVFHASIHLLLPLRFETEIGPPVEPERLVQLGEEALAMARQMEWAGGLAQALGLLGGFHGLLGRYDRGLPYLQEAIELAERLGYVVGISAGERMVAAVMAELLAFDDAEVRLHRALQAADQAGAQLFADIAALGLCQVLAARRMPGDLVEADDRLRGLLKDGRGALANGRIAREALVVQAELELSRGDAAAALLTLDHLIRGTCHLPEWGLSAIPRPALLMGRALAALGRYDEAAAALEEAVVGAARLQRRPLLWRAHQALGATLLAAHQRQPAEAQFAQARELIEAEAACVPDAELREAFLRKALAALPSPPTLTERRRAKAAHHGLTQRERDVAILVAAGDSNREIGEKLVISERTAERHVANILAKLGLRSRVQLAAWVAEHSPRD